MTCLHLGRWVIRKRHRERVVICVDCFYVLVNVHWQQSDIDTHAHTLALRKAARYKPRQKGSTHAQTR